jgi:hypothetical protein
LTQRVESLVQTANRLVPLRYVLSKFNIYVPEFTHSKSVKARCPYADMYHLDGDASKSMRVYSETNTGNCFMGCGTMTPVSVYAKLREISYRLAAFDLLEQIGHKPKTFEEKWQEAIDPPIILDRTVYRDSLMEYCYSINPRNWGIVQYNNTITRVITKLYEILDKATSDKEALKWLEVAKQYIHKVMEEEKLNA